MFGKVTGELKKVTRPKVTKKLLGQKLLKRYSVKSYWKVSQRKVTKTLLREPKVTESCSSKSYKIVMSPKVTKKLYSWVPSLNQKITQPYKVTTKMMNQNLLKGYWLKVVKHSLGEKLLKVNSKSPKLLRW